MHITVQMFSLAGMILKIFPAQGIMVFVCFHSRFAHGQKGSAAHAHVDVLWDRSADGSSLSQRAVMAFTILSGQWQKTKRKHQ